MKEGAGRFQKSWYSGGQIGLVQMAGGPLEYSEQAATFGPGDLMHGKDIKTDGCVCPGHSWVPAGADLEHRRGLLWVSPEGC